MDVIIQLLIKASCCAEPTEQNDRICEMHYYSTLNTGRAAKESFAEHRRLDFVCRTAGTRVETDRDRDREQRQGVILSEGGGVRRLYLSLEIMRVVVGVLRVHWLLFQAFAHVAGIPLAVAL